MDFHVFTTHSSSGTDTSPLQMISAALLAHYRRCEAVTYVVGALVLGVVLTGVILLVCSLK